ncbi:MAG: tetratricopeptide repeat protein, partial [Polyangiaceae bacterium]|nr:tetratricopeptide repeat protein [Polyangiaceae bacterium]
MLQDETVRPSRLPFLLQVAILVAFLPPRTAEAWEPMQMCEVEPASLWLTTYNACGVPLMQLPAPLLETRGADTRDPTAMSRARRHFEAGNYHAAIMALNGLEAQFPRVADHIALLRSEAASRAGMYDMALAAAEAATRSIDGTVRLRARVEHLRASIALDRPESVNELARLLRTYPELPERQQLRFARAESLERQGKVSEAVELYRSLDFEHPGGRVAAHSRERLLALAAAGAEVAPLTAEERVERGERLVRGGPLDDAREVLEALLGDHSLSRELRRRV